MTPRNSRERLISNMNELRKHIRKCYECRAAINSREPFGMCRDGAMYTVSAAREFNNVLGLQRRALAKGVDLIHACPDMSKHGEAYFLSAPLFHVTAVQEELF